MIIRLLILLFSLLAASVFMMYKPSSSGPQLISSAMIWDHAPHNAFTDLIDFQGNLFCCFRESDEHAGGKDGTVRILKSADGTSWTSVATLKKEGIDLRDPKFSILPEGKLMLSIGGSVYQQEKFIGRHPMVSFSLDGSNWAEVQKVYQPEEWIWGLTWYGEIGYGGSYRFTNADDVQAPCILSLVRTMDGVHYDKVTELKVPDYPNETKLQFLSDGSMVAMVRRKGHGWIGHASDPYVNWTWHDAGVSFGGPNFIVLPDGTMWGSSRLVRKNDNGVEEYSAIGPVTLTSYQPVLILPSGGDDTGYCGMVYRDGVLFVSYYSSHEGKANIYLASVKL